MKKLVKEIAGFKDEDLEALAQLLYDTDKNRALMLMRYVGIMDMESILEQRHGMII